MVEGKCNLGNGAQFNPDGADFKRQIFPSEEENQMEITGFKQTKWKLWITWTLYGLTLGLLRLVFHWYPQIKLYCTHSVCSLKVAEKVLIMDTYKRKYKTYFVKDIKTLKPDLREDGSNKLTAYLQGGVKKEMSEARILRCKKLTYLWDTDDRQFKKIVGLEDNIICSEFHNFRGYTKEQQTLKSITYGTNEIKVPVQSVLTLLILEALTPFYIFQVFTIILWFCEMYLYYSIAIIIMSVYGITSSIIQTRTNQRNLKGTVSSTDKITVRRGDGTFEEISTINLVPGDVIEVPTNGYEMQCDAVLLNAACIVNESMLTGESVPVTKTALPNVSKKYHIKNDASHTLFCGTKIIQTRNQRQKRVLAVVIRTGFLTTKGELIRSIMYPPPADFKFDQDSYKFIFILAVIGCMGLLYTVFSKAHKNIPVSEIAIKALDLMTIAIPPALPAAMTVGKLYALNRLKKLRIFCINSRVINVSGSVDCICFDKTGTLTEDGLDMWGVVPIENTVISNYVKDPRALGSNSLLFKGMLTCHTLTIINEEICGDPLDVKMFKSTDWNLREVDHSHELGSSLAPICQAYKEPESNEEVSIYYQFQFTSNLQRMSVIVKDKGSDRYRVFCKGAPETIFSLSNVDTVSAAIHDELRKYTRKGYRVIAVATKFLEDFQGDDFTQLQRDKVEHDLNLVGLIILENRLKPQTIGVIRTLKEANLKIAMITGDNIQTAVSVAKECEIIRKNVPVVELIATKNDHQEPEIQYKLTEDAEIQSNKMVSQFDYDPEIQVRYQIVITGRSWATISESFPSLKTYIVRHGVVFARMSGHQKQQLIEELQNVGHYVAMCGDGANDCSALKAAHVGISLSEAEASVASPFTSKENHIGCVPKIIREGRAALVTSFGVFKLMLCYSLTEFSTAIILYTIDANLTSMEFLFIDICLVLNFSSFFGNAKASERLHKKPPMTSLLSFVPLASQTLFMAHAIGFQVLVFHFIKTFEWFTPFVYKKSLDVYKCYENYAVFCVSMFQYITMAVVFTKGEPHRRPIYTNRIFLGTIVAMVAVCSYITLYPAGWVMQVLELQMPPVLDVRFMLLGISLANFLLAWFIEDFLIDGVFQRIASSKIMELLPRTRAQSIREEALEIRSKCDIVGKKQSVMQEIICETEKKNGITSFIRNGSREAIVTKSSSKDEKVH